MVRIITWASRTITKGPEKMCLWFDIVDIWFMIRFTYSLYTTSFTVMLDITLNKPRMLFVGETKDVIHW